MYVAIAKLKRIDFIVLCRNLPTKISGMGSVDSALAGHIEKGSRLNPYWNSAVPFASVKYGIYLVTRLDGWSWYDATSLVTRALAAKPGEPLFCDLDPSKTAGYVRWNYQMEAVSGATFDRTTPSHLPVSPWQDTRVGAVTTRSSAPLFGRP